MEAERHFLLGVSADILVLVSARSDDQGDRTARASRDGGRFELFSVEGRIGRGISPSRFKIDGGGLRSSSIRRRGRACSAPATDTGEIGRAHVGTPVTWPTRMPSPA